MVTDDDGTWSWTLRYCIQWGACHTPFVSSLVLAAILALHDVKGWPLCLLLAVLALNIGGGDS